MREASWCDASFEELTKLADARPHLQKIRERYLATEIPDWQRSHSETTLARAAKRDQDLVEAREQFAAGADGVRKGQDLGRLAWAAGVYFGDFQDIDLSLPPVERLRRTFGEENASAAIEGFVATLGRSDLPSLSDVVALAAQRRQHPCATSLLAGMDTIWERSRDFAGFHDDLLRVMVARRSELVGLVRRALERLTDGPDAPRDIWLTRSHD
jgi:hypothetical protein